SSYSTTRRPCRPPLFPYTTLFRSTFELSTDGINYTALATPTRIAGGWQLTGQALPTRQNIFIRARGFYSTGESDGSYSIAESVRDRKSTRLNSSHQIISYAVFCLK